MPYRQIDNPKKPDLVFNSPKHGQIAIEFKWKTVNERPEVASVTFTPLDPQVPFEPVILRGIPLSEIINTQRTKLLPNRRVPRQERPRAMGPDKTRTLTDDDLKYIADLYAEAWKTGIPVQRHIADALKIAVPTAARRISLARSRGFISHEINPSPRKKKTSE